MSLFLSISKNGLPTIFLLAFVACSSDNPQNTVPKAYDASLSTALNIPINIILTGDDADGDQIFFAGDLFALKFTPEEMQTASVMPLLDMPIVAEVLGLVR